MPARKAKYYTKKYVDGASAEWNKTFKTAAYASQSNNKSTLKTKISALGLVVNINADNIVASNFSLQDFMRNLKSDWSCYNTQELLLFHQNSPVNIVQ